MPFLCRQLEKPPVRGFHPVSSSRSLLRLSLALKGLGASLYEELFTKFAGDGRSLANTVARAMHGPAHGPHMPPGDGGNFVKREALDTIEEKSFAVGAVGAAKRGLH